MALKFYDIFVPTQRRDFGAALIEIVSYSLMNWALFARFFTVRNATTPAALEFRSGAVLLVYLFVTPVLLALIVYYAKTWDRLRAALAHVGLRVLAPAPTAWDHFFEEGLSCYIIFHLKSKDILGAVFHKDSFATAYPDIQQVYVEQLWVIDPATRRFIQPVANSKGAIIKLDDCDYIEMFAAQPAQVNP